MTTPGETQAQVPVRPECDICGDRKVVQDGIGLHAYPETAPCPKCQDGSWAYRALISLRISHSLPGDWEALEARARSLATEFMRENGIGAHWDTAEIYHTFALWLLRSVSAPAALTPSPCPGDGMREALEVGERFLNACNSAWAAGEPPHRVVTMLNLADEFRSKLDTALTPSALSDLQRLGQDYDDGSLGRFGHHPDPAIDFECEVEQIESIVADLEKGMRQGEPVPMERIARAMTFRVGGDPGAVAAKATLRELEKRASALSVPVGDDLAKGLRTSQKALDEIARQEQANIAGYLALRDFPVGSASAQFPPDEVGPNALGSDGPSIAAQLREISRISNKYDLRECIEGHDDALGDSYIWRDLMDHCEKLGSKDSALSGDAGEGE